MLLVPDGLAGQVLTNIGVSISKVIEDLETTLSRNQRIDLKSIMPTSRVKEVIEIASREAARSGSDKIHTTHLVLAILVEGKGIAALILDQNGATTDLVRAQCEKL